MTDLERILAKTLMEVLIFADLSDDDDIDPDVATKLFEPVAAVLQNISAEDRRTVAELITQCAEEETDPERRLTALDLPEALGLTWPEGAPTWSSS